MHHMFLKAYKEQFPAAKIVGPKGLNKKKETEGWQLDGGAFQVSIVSESEGHDGSAVFDADRPDHKHGFEDEVSLIMCLL